MRNIVYFTNEHRQIFQALNRYYRHVLNIHLEKSQTWKDALHIILNESDLFDLSILKKILINNFHLGVIGFSEKNGNINLLNLNNLYQNVQPDSFKLFSVDQYFTKSELINELSCFFKSHGPDSFINKINKMLYCLNNYNLCTNSIIRRSDYYDEFIKPALRNWKINNTKKNKYFSIILLLGFKFELNEIEQTISIIEDNLFCLNEEYFLTHLDIDQQLINLKKLYDKLLKILNEIKNRVFDDGK